MRLEEGIIDVYELSFKVHYDLISRSLKSLF